MNRRRIRKGDKLGDLPIERPSRLELTASVKTAKALDIAIAQSLQLARR